MAYDEYLGERIHKLITEKTSNFYTKKMMGGLLFMVDEKMFCGIHFDKKKNMDLMMARIGEEAFEEALQRQGCHPMDFTGRPMKGYVFIDPTGFDMDEYLEHWVDLCFAFNPFALSNKKKQTFNLHHNQKHLI